jgi:AcrR family transcriptional regulator
MLKKGEQTKEHILVCAEKVFSRKGYYESQVSDISQMAQIAKGTIYQYFKNKESLYISLIEKYVVEWENKVALNLSNFLGTGGPGRIMPGLPQHRIAKSMAFFAENPGQGKHHTPDEHRS